MKTNLHLLLFLFSSLLLHLSLAEQCGQQAGGALCPNGLCCSKYGWCGSSDEYCKDGCQSQCTLNSLPPAPTLHLSLAEQCGQQAGGALCPNGLCCSKYGWCGSSDDYCKDGCQSQCTPDSSPPAPTAPGGDLTNIITSAQFDEMLKHRNYGACPARVFYTYDAFITAAKFFPEFGTTGDTAARKKEIAAFFGQTSHETTRGWPRTPDGPYAWGYCFKEEVNPSSDYCLSSSTWPCASSQRYFGRGPMQLSWNYNYGQCGRDVGLDLLNNPGLVASDPVTSFKAAIWFWMTPQSPKPSSHDVITDQWQPSAADQAAGRVPGYGVITNIINGGFECGHGQDVRVASRIGFYERYCSIFGVNPGDNLDCYNQRPFGSGLLLEAAL